MFTHTPYVADCHVMFTTADRAKFADLAQRAAAHPLDFHDLLSPGKVVAFGHELANLWVQMDKLIISFAHERLPPDWRIYRHLSVSESGKPASEQAFLEIAKEFGMGDMDKWNHDLGHVIEQWIPFALQARHAFELVVN